MSSLSVLGKLSARHMSADEQETAADPRHMPSRLSLANTGATKLEGAYFDPEELIKEWSLFFVIVQVISTLWSYKKRMPSV